MAEYQSSEEFQRTSRGAFTDAAASKEKQEQETEKQKLQKVLDVYIAKHGSTKAVRAMAKDSKRSADYQLDLSADLVEILEKIKKELR